MLENKPYITIAAHDGEFHADDVCAVATLMLHVGDSTSIKVVRTRVGTVLDEADYVVDVGRVHDISRNRFDHHQIGGAGERENGIPYAAFGLVWQAFGKKIAGSEEVFEIIDRRLVQPIDALDNGVVIAKEVFPNVRNYGLSSLFGGMNPDWNEDKSKTDSLFLEAVELAKSIIFREVRSAQADIAARDFVLDAYNQSEDKRLIVLDNDYPWENVLMDFPEPLYVVYPKENAWYIKTIRKGNDTFETRKRLPPAWGGKTGKELSAVTGIPGGVFCHKVPFIASAETKEAALAMAHIALQS